MVIFPSPSHSMRLVLCCTTWATHRDLQAIITQLSSFIIILLVRSPVQSYNSYLGIPWEVLSPPLYTRVIKMANMINFMMFAVFVTTEHCEEKYTFTDKKNLYVNFKIDTEIQDFFFQTLKCLVSKYWQNIFIVVFIAWADWFLSIQTWGGGPHTSHHPSCRSNYHPSRRDRRDHQCSRPSSSGL